MEHESCHTPIVSQDLQYVSTCNVASLVPKSPPFLPSVCVHNKIQNWKISKKLKWERPGNIHHVSGCEVDVGGGGGAISY